MNARHTHSWTEVQRIGPTARGAAIAVLAFVAATAVPRPGLATANFVYHEPSDAPAGIDCGAYFAPTAPGPTDSVAIRFKVEYQGYTDELRLYYTTDGTAPTGALGVPGATTQSVVGSYVCVFEYAEQSIDVAAALIPAQAAGTRVRYIVSAWHSGGGPEIFGNSGTCSECTACDSAACAEIFEYTVVGSGADGGIGDAAAPDAATPDAATLDAATPDAAIVDSASPDLGAVDGGIEDALQSLDRMAGEDAASPPDAVASDVGAGDVAVSDAALPDAAAPDGGPIDGSALDRVQDAGGAGDTASLDAASDPDVATECLPGCQDEGHRVVCDAEGASLVIPCSAGTSCRDGSCVAVDSPPTDPEEEGCGCQAAPRGGVGLISLFVVGLAGRRRWVQRARS